MIKDAISHIESHTDQGIYSSSDVEKLIQENETLHHKVSHLNITLEEAQKKIHWFEEQIKLGRQRQFGKRSEKLNIQQEIIFDADETLQRDISSSSLETEVASYTRRKKTVGRRIDTSLLLKTQEIHDLSETQKICSCCGGALHKFRDEISETIETIPEQKYVVEHIHPQYACRQCETIVSAEKDVAPIPKCMAGPSLLTDIIIHKYQYHLPLYRQSKLFQSSGLDIPDNTLGNWVMQVGEGLRCLDEAFCEEILCVNYLQVDETPVKVLKPEKKAYMWCYLSPLENQRLIRFRFDMTRSGSVAEKDLEAFKGLLQSDGYSGYNDLRKREQNTPFGCMAHARRKFAEVVKIGSVKSTGKAEEAIRYFGLLYEIESNARKQKLTVEERKQLRQSEATPIVKQFYAWLNQTKSQVPPESAIGRAIAYTIKQWPYLSTYVNYGEVEIDTNWVENEIRPFAIGRRNWLFLGNEESAQIAALFYSLIQSAKLNNLNPRIYLHYLITQIHLLRKKEVDPKSLLPHRIDRNKLQLFADAEFQKSRKVLSLLTAHKN